MSKSNACFFFKTSVASRLLLNVHITFLFSFNKSTTGSIEVTGLAVKFFAWAKHQITILGVSINFGAFVGLVVCLSSEQ